MFRHWLEYPVTALFCFHQLWQWTLTSGPGMARGHLAVGKMALEMSQPGWQCPPVTVESHPAAKYQAAACSLPPHGEEENRGGKKINLVG